MRIYETDTFWGRVKEQAARRGISLKELAAAIDMPYGTLTNSISNGTIPKKGGVTRALAKTLDVDVEYLVSGGMGSDSLKMTDQEVQLILRYRLLSPTLKRALEDTLETLEEVDTIKANAISNLDTIGH